jgi:hypothetical protein
MTTELQDILVTISPEAGLIRKVQPLGLGNADRAFITKKMGFVLLVKYYVTVTGLEVPTLVAPYEISLIIDNDTLVNADGSYATEGAVAGVNGVMGEYDWLITAFQAGGLAFETFFPYVITRADSLNRFNRV